LSGEGGSDEQVVIYIFQYKLVFPSKVTLLYDTFVTKVTEASYYRWEHLQMAPVYYENISGSMVIYTVFNVLRSLKLREEHTLGGARGSVVGRGAMLQARRSRDRIPMR
jgi:hypothetical protein